VWTLDKLPPTPAIVSTNKSRPWHGGGNKSELFLIIRPILRAALGRQEGGGRGEEGRPALSQRRSLYIHITTVRTAYKTSRCDVFIAREGRNGMPGVPKGIGGERKVTLYVRSFSQT